MMINAHTNLNRLGPEAAAAVVKEFAEEQKVQDREEAARADSRL
jgi:hypothetical protein